MSLRPPPPNGDVMGLHQKDASRLSGHENSGDHATECHITDEEAWR
jgi:hypothetical protein